MNNLIYISFYVVFPWMFVRFVRFSHDIAYSNDLFHFIAVQCAMVCIYHILFILQLMNSWIVSSLGLSLTTFLYTYLVHMCVDSSRMCTYEWNCWIMEMNFTKWCQTGFLSVCTRIHFHWQGIRVLVVALTTLGIFRL